MLEQLQQMQTQMEQAQEELKDETVQATAGGGMVTVIATGSGEIRQITIDPKAMMNELAVASSQEWLAKYWA